MQHIQKISIFRRCLIYKSLKFILSFYCFEKMKKNNLKRNHSDFNDNYEFGKKGSGSRDKSSKKRLSIYDEYEEEDDLFLNQEKFKNRRK